MTKISVDVHPQIRDAKDVYELLCLSSLIQGGKLPVTATIEDADSFYALSFGCDTCPLEAKCLACIINQ